MVIIKCVVSMVSKTRLISIVLMAIGVLAAIGSRVNTPINQMWGFTICYILFTAGWLYAFHKNKVTKITLLTTAVSIILFWLLFLAV
jgi:hypothetical protein